MRLGVQAALVGNEIVPGDVAINDGVIESVGLSPAGKSGLAVPGFIDVQINGFDGVDFTTAEPDDYETVAARLAATGVTAFQPTLITLPPDHYVAALERLSATSIRSGRILGMHLEGPFLSPRAMRSPRSGQYARSRPRSGPHIPRIGARHPHDHRSRTSRSPRSHRSARRLRGHGGVGPYGCRRRHRPRRLRSRRPIGDSHLRAQRPWKHRDPGISGAALVRDDVYITAIVDGIHLAPETVQLAARCARERFVLITDAISAAGRPDGAYALGDRTVILSDGACRLEDGTLAGSSLTMDRAVRNMIELGFTPPQAISAATTAPAAWQGNPSWERLLPAPRPTCACSTTRTGVVRTMVAGKETFET